MENAVKTKVKGVWEEFSEVSGFGATTVLSRSLRKIVDFKIKCADEDYTDTDAVHELLEELKVDMTKYQHVDFIMDRTHTMAGFSLDMKARDYLGTTKDWARLPFREFVKHDSNIWAKTFLPAIKNFLRTRLRFCGLLMLRLFSGLRIGIGVCYLLLFLTRIPIPTY